MQYRQYAHARGGLDMARRQGETRASGDLFAAPTPLAPAPAGMDYRAAVAHLVGDMLRGAEGDRYEIAARVSRLVGKDVSKYMLDAYTAESREEFNAPAWLMPALEVACATHLYSSWLATTRGGALMVGRDVIAAELGRVERQRDELNAAAKDLRERMRKGGR